MFDSSSFNTRHPMDHIDIQTALHALNTFPKAFFIWGILDKKPQRAVEMEERLGEEFPYLSRFTFLNRKNFAQYCYRSLRGIVVKDYTYWEYMAFQKEVSAWGLIDDFIQPIAGFILAKCGENGVNCESFLASRKNSSSLSNVLCIRIFERLYKEKRVRVYDLADSLDLDPTGVDRHLIKLSSNNFAAYEVPSSNRNLRKRMVKDTVVEITQDGKVIFENILMPIASLMNGKKYNDRVFRETEPDDVHLIKVMEMYSKGLEPQPEFKEN